MAESAKKVTPPYASFPSLLSFLNKLRETTIPSRIDPSVFGNASGTISYSVIAALKSLKLIDATGVPSAQFKELVLADDAARKVIFAKVVREGYPTLFDGKIDLTTISAGHFDEHIRDEFEAKGSTVDKMASFFIAAATFAGEQISPHLKSRKATASSASSKQNVKKRKQETDDTGQLPERVPIPTPSTVSKPLEYQLIDLMSEPDVEDEVKTSIWALVQYLTARKKKATTAAS